MLGVAWTATSRWISIALVCVLIVFMMVIQRESIMSSSRITYYTRPRSSLLPDQGKFWQSFKKDLDEYGPKVYPLIHPEDTNLGISFNASDHRTRPDHLMMSIPQWEAMHKSHSSFVEKIRAQEYHLPYNASTRGIVTTAGGPYLPVALVSIRMLRESGSNLPVEVFLSDWKEFDPIICGKILPALNAKCLILQDIFDYDHSTKKAKSGGIDKYQYKIMAILFSSFEDVLFLDSDCFPIHDPESLFLSEPFASTGLVLWPDFWFPSESPLFFEIASIQPPPIYTRASTEAGEILYSKRKHELSLLLAAYYNYYGPKFFYPLQSQGAPGEGDKETFLWSAVALDAPFYTVKQRVHALGYTTKSDGWKGSAMAQFDPMQDLNADGAPKDEKTMYPRPFFAHVNFPKLDPGQIFEAESFGATGPTRDSDGTIRRVWHENEDDAVRFFGFDLERTVWRVVKDVACEYEGDFVSWKRKKNICKKAQEYWNAVFGGEER
ncbi:mannosyltransferase [Neophaeococcomyces mojaviensis]|uniref:Mannosyltransferase n=1 Tax=Neophaeococcomyces mojaviensis TaxID=3383035 RepID=A0ACC3AL75_9EURO|nr:mannosyltransferase [Knufia sp. JES_112]